MSTYYYFACDECREYGGWFSRQAWGWGNMDIVDTFAFLANHIASCGHENVRLISEHATYDLGQRGWTHIVSQEDASDGLHEGQRVADHLLATFPHSTEWKRSEEVFAAYVERKREVS